MRPIKLFLVLPIVFSMFAVADQNTSKSEVNRQALIRAVENFRNENPSRSASDKIKMAMDVETNRLSMVITTTLTHILPLNEIHSVVGADNDVRFIVIENTRENDLLLLREAQRNGWAVELELEKITLTETDSQRSVFEVSSFNVNQQDAPMRFGYDDPDTKFSPLVVTSEEDIYDLFSEVYPYDAELYDANDNCFNRAQYWSRDVQVYLNEYDLTQGTDKVFIFFSNAYIKKHDHKWWYHVAPVVYQGTPNERYSVLDEGSQPCSNPKRCKTWVFDGTFLGDPVSLKDWLTAFAPHADGSEKGMPCKKISTLDDYYDNNHKPICMYIVRSMFHYAPSDLKRRQMNNWRCRDFDAMLKSIDPPGAQNPHVNPKYSWQDFDYIVPDMCK